MISIAFPLIEKTNFEFALRSAVPFEIMEFIPLITLNTDSAKKKIERFNKPRILQIMINAMKQSGNPYLPKLLSPTDLRKIKYKNYDLVITSHITGEDIKMLKSEITEAEKILLVIGPEGDFTDDELDFLITKGTEKVKLNTYILRSEVAMLSLLSQVRAF